MRVTENMNVMREDGVEYFACVKCNAELGPLSANYKSTCIHEDATIKHAVPLSGDPELGEMMALNYRVAKLDPRQRAMLDFAWKMTVTPHLVDDADRDGLRAVGLTNDDIFDLSETVAFAAEAFEGTLTDLYIPKK